MQTVWKKLSQILHLTTGLLLVYTKLLTFIVLLLHKQWGHFSTVEVADFYELSRFLLSGWLDVVSYLLKFLLSGSFLIIGFI
jgi:hypothetical protein